MNRNVIPIILLLCIVSSFACRPHKTTVVTDPKAIDSLFGAPPFKHDWEGMDSTELARDRRQTIDELLAPLVALGDSLDVALADSVEEHYDGDWPSVISLSVPVFERVNISHPGNDSLDFIVMVRLESESSHGSAAMIFVFLENDGKYDQEFYWEGYHHASEPSIALPDIDCDGRAEIALTFDGSGNGSTDEMMKIFKYEEGSFRLIFSESLSASWGVNPYTYSNEVEFAQNRHNRSLLDIRFIIATSLMDEGYADKSELKKELEEYGLEDFKPTTDTVLFVFNGKKYVPVKPVPDYRKFLVR